MSDFSAYIPHVAREDLLLKAIESIAAYGKNRVIIDNSPNGLETDDWQHWNGVYVIRPSVPLSCSQTFNFIMRMTRRRGEKICVWMHSDAEAGPDVAQKLLDFARSETRKWGVLFTYYDTLSVLNTDLLDEVGEWDVTLPQYYADSDYYRRVRLAGWECIDTGLTDVKHAGSATINSSQFRQIHNSVTFPLYMNYYLAKWGGHPGNEQYLTPFGWTP